MCAKISIQGPMPQTYARSLLVDEHYINQNDSKDRCDEIGQMDKMNANAGFTIGAGSGKDSSVGLPRIGTIRRIMPPYTCVPGKGYSTTLRRLSRS